MNKQFEQAYDNFLAGVDVDTTMLDCAEFMFNAGRESVGKGEPVAFNGWYCAQCQRGVSPSEVTYHETHEVCGRYITDDAPPTPAVAQEPVFHDCTFSVGPKLVRLNDDALVSIYLECKAEWKSTDKRQRQRIAVIFGNAIMDAMERANQ